MAIGVMSGTSVDGLDIAAVRFKLRTGKWEYKIIRAESVAYEEELRNLLIHSVRCSGEELVRLDLELGRFIGRNVYRFLKDNKIQADLIASHGHTVYHQPELGMTRQVGNGQCILSETGITTVNDFRTMDVIKGGQGAPLVPVGDHHLFSEYDVCLNIGGFANISYQDHRKQRIAYDTGPANLLLNYLSRKIGFPYDKGGSLARKGNFVTGLFEAFNQLPYYRQPPPKSLGLEWVEGNILDRLNASDYPAEDLLNTCVHHIAHQINHSIQHADILTDDPERRINVLVTGGGAHNEYLIETLRNADNNIEYILPPSTIIDFKEALIFAFLGILRVNREINVWKTVTGASSDTIGGTIHDNL